MSVRCIKWLCCVSAAAGAAACTSRFGQQGFIVPPNLTLNVSSDGRYSIDGRPLLESPPVETAPLRVAGGFAITEIKLQHRWGSWEWRQEIVADTGGILCLRLPHSTFDRARSWTWTESVDRTRVWNLMLGVTSLGVIDSLSICGARLRHVPASFDRDGPWTLPLLGIQLLTLFDAVVFAWSQGELRLVQDAAELSTVVGEQHPARTVSLFRWWTGVPSVGPGRGCGFVVVGASVDGAGFEAILDTGANSELVLPRSIALVEPWASRLRPVDSIMLHGPTGSAMAERYTLGGELTIGGTEWGEIGVLVMDDSTLPPGTTLLPIIGTPLLSRFERVTFDFANEVIIFDRKAEARSVE